jgi:hypothetical protein
MRHRKLALVSVTLGGLFIAPLTARALFGVIPVVDWDALLRLGQEIGVSQNTLNTLSVYVSEYSRINAGVPQGIALYRGKNLQGLLSQGVGSEFPQFQELQRDFRNVRIDSGSLRNDLEETYGNSVSSAPIPDQQRIDAVDATATMGLLDASRVESVAEQEELDADDLEDRAAVASPGGAEKLSAAATSALVRSEAYNQRLLARLMRIQALALARENSIDKESEQIRQQQLTTISGLVGGMALSYGIGDQAR